MFTTERIRCNLSTFDFSVFMNPFRCKQVKTTVVLGFKIQAIGLFTVTLEKGFRFRKDCPFHK